MQHYNLALIFVGFQRCCVYLSIIKELSKKYKIAVYPQSLDEKTLSRIEKTNSSFLTLCERFGANLVYNEKITADIEILPQTHYSEEQICILNTSVMSNQTYWLSGVAMGNAQFEHLFGKKIDGIFVVDRQFYDYRVSEYEKNNNGKFKDEEILEVGMPYKKYPVFPALDIDYIIANPTPFSFRNIKDRLTYLENVCTLMDKIDRDNIVALKPHNADERVDYIVDKRLFLIVRLKLLGAFHPLIDNVSRFLAMSIPNARLSDFFTKISIAILYNKLMSRVVSFKDITKWHNLNLELFLPSVKKGLITGRSNSIWHGLFLKKPTYNCVESDKPYYSETKMHKFSMQYLNVHGNYKSIEFNDCLYEKISEETRDVDIISLLDNKLKNL